MKVLVIGAGGREHALAWRLKRCPSVDEVLCAPGGPDAANAGLSREGRLIPVDVANHHAVLDLCREERIGLVVVGPEIPLVAGLADPLRAAGVPVLGPSAQAARLEGSKAFTKALCARFNIPTAAHATFTDVQKARDYVENCDLPVVIKADGLAAGKGVVIAQSRAEARAVVNDMLGTAGDGAQDTGRFGAAARTIVIEEFLRGEEASFFALTDGRVVMPFGGGQDHKKVGDGDTGPNTGGMGAYSPAPVLDKAMEHEALTRIIQPTIEAMARIGSPYEGVLYAGLMITENGPKLIEYNCRFGDPECQVLMLRAEGDVADVFHKVATHRLEDASMTWSADAALTVVMAADGYPGSYAKGTEIRNLDHAGLVEGVTIFHAGTRRDDRGRLLANGGRVLNVSARGADVREAQARAYKAVARIDWPEGFCRQDIAWRALDRAPRSA